MEAFLSLLRRLWGHRRPQHNLSISSPCSNFWVDREEQRELLEEIKVLTSYPQWKDLEEYLRWRLCTLHREMEALPLDASSGLVAISELRGRAREIRHILDLRRKAEQPNRASLDQSG